MFKLLKAAGKKGIYLLGQWSETVFRRGEITREWKETIILNPYKGKGNALGRGNYRGLKLKDEVMELLERVLDSFIREMVDNYRLEEDVILIIRQL